jgi:hypothetical protein
MNQSYPVPPPELLEQWRNGGPSYAMANNAYEHHIAAQAARWGADQELEACCDHLRDYQWGFVDRPDGTKMHRAVDLELARRPKPPSLKEQALAVLDDCANCLDGAHENTIRRALEQLPDAL